MNLFERAASLIDESIELNEGAITKNYCKSPNYTGKFFEQLEKPASQIMNLPKTKNGPRQPIGDVIRAQYSLLSKIIERDSRRDAIHANKLKDPFIVGTMDFIGRIVDEIDNGDTDTLYCIGWPTVVKYIKENGDRLIASGSHPAKANNVVFDTFKLRVIDPELKKLKNTAAYKNGVKQASRQNVKAILGDGVMQQEVSQLSNGRFSIMLSPISKTRPPIIVDNQKKLILNFRNYETLETVLAATNATELYNTIKNQFDGSAGIFTGITSTTIPEGIEFQYQDDALVACDWSMFNSVINRLNERGTYKLAADPKICVIFSNNGDSLRSGYDVGETESRYVNWFDKNNNEFGVRLNRNDKFNGMYTNTNYTFYVFEIVQYEGSQNYVSRGTYKIDSTQTTNDTVIYNRISKDMKRLVGTPSSAGTGASTAGVETSDAYVEEAIKQLIANGYSVIKG